jgi:hypothetical protein
LRKKRVKLDAGEAARISQKTKKEVESWEAAKTFQKTDMGA